MEYTIRVHISGDDSDRNVRDTLARKNKGYYLGKLTILRTPYHIEAIQIN